MNRLFDISFTLLISPLIILVTFISAIFVIVESKTFPFYMQKRVGKKRKVFKIVKIKTMKDNFDFQSYLDSNPDKKKEWREYQKLKDDIRITKVGKFLRKISIDKFPQFLNILKGDMTLIGPRPITTDQIDLYPYDDYYSVLPGITGLWQTEIRNGSDFLTRAKYDRIYIQSKCFLLDMKIFFKTFFVILSAKGS